MPERCHWRLSTILALACFVSTGAAAQERRWEIEVYGGAVAGRSATEGSRTLPPAGAPLVTSTPIFPSREVPSWFFGDGAVLLNGVVEEFGGAAKIAPLDALFSAAAGGRSAAAGVRMRRRLSPRLSAEVSVDWLGSIDAASPEFDATVERARSSYPATIRDLLATGPFASVFVDATGSSDPGQRREMSATGAVNIDFRSFAAFTPYATVGGGVLNGNGEPPSAELTGRYRFVVLGELSIDESERVRLRVERPTSMVVVLGGGLRRDLSAQWGLRIDVRALVGPDTTRVTIDTEAASVLGTPAGFVESFTNPAIQFSNDPSTGRRSSLSAAPLQAFRVFEGGAQVRTVVAIAVSRRF